MLTYYALFVHILKHSLHEYKKPRKSPTLTNPGAYNLGKQSSNTIKLIRTNNDYRSSRQSYNILPKVINAIHIYNVNRRTSKHSIYIPTCTHVRSRDMSLIVANLSIHVKSSTTRSTVDSSNTHIHNDLFVLEKNRCSRKVFVLLTDITRTSPYGRLGKVDEQYI